MTWDKELVGATFFHMDVDVILATPIREEFEDFVAWQFDSKGTFSVKFAYKLYVQERDGPKATSSRPREDGLQWEKIWKIVAQPKIKQFMWRLAHNSLATKRNIEKKGIECDTLCVCCKSLDEDGAHLFLRCREVRKAWKELKMEKVHDRLCMGVDSKEVVQIVFGLKEDD
jgi:hypothetical protein